jgi:hypothetical protein
VRFQQRHLAHSAGCCCVLLEPSHPSSSQLPTPTAQLSLHKCPDEGLGQLNTGSVVGKWAMLVSGGRVWTEIRDATGSAEALSSPIAELV